MIRQYAIHHLSDEKFRDSYDITKYSFDFEGKDYSYTTRSERALEELKTETTKDNTFDIIAADYSRLKEKIAAEKQEDLKRYQDQIRELLKLEIITRYYYQKGKIISAMKGDKELDDAIDLIRDNEKYLAILSGRYQQPKPEIQVKGDEEEDDLPVETDIP